MKSISDLLFSARLEYAFQVSFFSRRRLRFQPCFQVEARAKLASAYSSAKRICLFGPAILFSIDHGGSPDELRLYSQSCKGYPFIKLLNYNNELKVNIIIIIENLNVHKLFKI